MSDREVRGEWRETMVLTILAALTIALLSREAFRTYFFAEAFVYLGSYRAAGDDFLATLLRPHGLVFYRPSLWAANLLFNLALPSDASVYHVRNFFFVVLNALLLHRFLVRIAPSRFARACGVGFYAASKVHLTTIGYAATFSTILMLTATLVMVVFFFRFAEGDRLRDAAVSIAAAVFLIFSKDYGAGVVLVLPALVPLARADWRRVAKVFAPALSIALVAYVVLRLAIVPSLPREGAYAPSLVPERALRKSVAAASTLANLSMFETEGRTGARGITRAFWADDTRQGRIAEGILLGAMFTAMGLVLLLGRVSFRLAMPCIVWATAMFGPTLLTQNEQLYYHNDLVAAAAVLLAGALAPSARISRAIAVALLVLLVLNAEWSQRRMRYDWHYVSELVEPLDEIVPLLRESEADRIVFVTDKTELWSFALTADGLAPFLPALLDREAEVVVTPVSPEAPAAGTVVIRPDERMRIVAK